MLHFCVFFCFFFFKRYRSKLRLMDVFVSLNSCSFSRADSNAPLDGSRGSGVSPAANRLCLYAFFFIIKRWDVKSWYDSIHLNKTSKKKQTKKTKTMLHGYGNFNMWNRTENREKKQRFSLSSGVKFLFSKSFVPDFNQEKKKIANQFYISLLTPSIPSVVFPSSHHRFSNTQRGEYSVLTQLQKHLVTR